MLGGLCQWTRCSKLSDQGPPNPDINRLLSSPRQSYQISENGKVTVDRNGELIKVASIPNDHGYSMISMMPEKRRYPQMRECPHFGCPHVHYPVLCDVFFCIDRYVKRQDFWRVPHFFRDMEADFDEEEECPWRFVEICGLLKHISTSDTVMLKHTHTHIYIYHISFTKLTERDT